MKNLFVKIVARKLRHWGTHAGTTAQNACILSMLILTQGTEKKNVTEPIKVELDSKKGYVIVFRCKKCGEIRKNKAAKDDNMDLLIKLTASEKY